MANAGFFAGRRAKREIEARLAPVLEKTRIEASARAVAEEAQAFEQIIAKESARQTAAIEKAIASPSLRYRMGRDGVIKTIGGGLKKWGLIGAGVAAVVGVGGLLLSGRSKPTPKKDYLEMPPMPVAMQPMEMGPADGRPEGYWQNVVGRGQQANVSPPMTAAPAESVENLGTARGA